MARKRKRKRTADSETETPARQKKNRKARLQATLPTKLSKKPKATKLSSLSYDPRIFETMRTGTIVDRFFANKVGIPRACNFIVVGDPGVGKSTVCLDILANVQNEKAKKNKVLFISAEMNEIDMFEYMERYPKFGEIDILFLGDYVDENPKLVIEQMLEEGYDLVLGDSFVEIQETVKETCYMTTSQAEKWLIDLMLKNNKGQNNSKAYTTFLMIQQVTKGGVFVGSNKLKHSTTGMLDIRFSGSENSGQRYVEFSKNRRGEVNRRLFFALNIPEDVSWNEEKWNMDKINRDRMEKELNELAKEADAFDVLLKHVEPTPTPEAQAAEASAETILDSIENEDDGEGDDDF